MILIFEYFYLTFSFLLLTQELYALIRALTVPSHESQATLNHSRFARRGPKQQ